MRITRTWGRYPDAFFKAGEVIYDRSVSNLCKDCNEQLYNQIQVR